MAGYYDRDRNPAGETRTAAGTMNHAYPHHNSAAEYMCSGVPFVYTHTISSGTNARANASDAVTSGGATDLMLGRYKAKLKEDGTHSGTYLGLITGINFPFVTKWLMVRVFRSDTGAEIDTINVGFGHYDEDDGVENVNYVRSSLLNGTMLELKCKRIYISIPGTYAGTDGTLGSGVSVKVEVLAGLTNVRDFPVFDNGEAQMIPGITSEDLEGAVGDTSAFVQNTDAYSAAAS